ncbi:putative oxidoreductase [Spathaspora sp. JA1]|nr:putative oxidoreductase [Spathaspora sp. JA1]
MSYRLIQLNSGKKIPSIGLGCYNIPLSQTSQIVYEACKLGYRHFDTAVLYGNEEQVIEGITRYLHDHPNTTRTEFFYTTKLWNSQLGQQPTVDAINIMKSQIGELEYIDLLLIHSPLPGKTKRLESYKVMQDFVDQGFIKNIGVSNYGIHHIEELLNWPDLKYPPSVNQIEISPWCMRTELAHWCLDRGIQVEAFSPLTHGYRLQTDVFSDIRKKYNKSLPQLLIKWSLQKGYIPLPKTKTNSRLIENLNIDDFELTSEEIKIIDQPDSYDPTDWECTDAP